MAVIQVHVSTTPLLLTLFTFLIIPLSRVLLKKLNGSQLVKKFPAFYGNQRIMPAFKNARHPFLL